MEDIKYTPANYKSDQAVRWCPGCGDHGILNTLHKAMASVGVPPHKMAVISGIGCSSRLPYYMNTYGFHTIHGRAAAIATGFKVARPDILLRVAFIEDTYRRPLRYHLGLFRVELRNGHDHRLELNYLVLADVHQRSIGSHPGSACSGIYGEDALAGVEEVGRIAGNLKGGEGSLFRMFRNISQKLCGSVMEEQYLSLRSGVARLLLAKHLNHHI